MRYFQGSCEQGVGLYVLNTDETEIYRYVQELKTWNRDVGAEDHYFFPELHEDTGLIEFTEIAREGVYPLIPAVARFDRRDEVQRRLSLHARGQLRRSGSVLTSAEVGLLTLPLQQRVITNPAIRELIEVRSRYRRWTTVVLQDNDGPARRQAMKTIRENQKLRTNSAGDPLEVRHTSRTYRLGQQTQQHVAIEAKYEHAPANAAGEGGTDEHPDFD